MIWHSISNEELIEMEREARRKRQMKSNSEITYRDCADAMLKMWMDNVLTDAEYNRIMDKLNAKEKEGNE